jgi:hypothetical protein
VSAGTGDSGDGDGGGAGEQKEVVALALVLVLVLVENGERARRDVTSASSSPENGPSPLSEGEDAKVSSLVSVRIISSSTKSSSSSLSSFSSSAYLCWPSVPPAHCRRTPSWLSRRALCRNRCAAKRIRHSSELLSCVLMGVSG